MADFLGAPLAFGGAANVSLSSAPNALSGLVPVAQPLAGAVLTFGGNTPHIPAPGEFGGIALEAGVGQRFPFTARVVGVPVPVLLVDEDGVIV